MQERQEMIITEMLKSVPTGALIAALQMRDLTTKEIETLQSFGKKEEISDLQPRILQEETQQDVELSAERFVKAVTRKNVTTFAPVGTKIDGMIDVKKYSDEYCYSGPDVFERKLNTVWLAAQRITSVDDLQILASNIVGFEKSETDENNIIVTTCFLNDNSPNWDTLSLSSSILYVSAEMPNEIAAEFKENILKNPDLLEDYYQKMFPGLDGKPDRLGVARIKADGFYLIEKELDSVLRTSSGKETTTKTISNLKKHYYKNGPYGTGPTAEWKLTYPKLREVSQTLLPAEKIEDFDMTTESEIKDAEKFAKAVVRKNVMAKLPFGSKIDGAGICKSSNNGWMDHGPDKFEELKKDDFMYGLLNFISNNDLNNYINSNFISIEPSKTKDNTIITTGFFQDKKIDNRAYTSAHISTEMPNEIAAEFIKEILKNPDLLEDFYQKVYPGLDSINGQPGARRIKSDGFYLITRKDFYTAEKETGRGSNRVEMIKKFISASKKHHYKNGPYGSGDAF